MVIFYSQALSHEKNTEALIIMKIMRLKEVMDTTGLKRSAIYKAISEGRFPKQVSLGARAAGWVADEIESWIMERIEERDMAYEGKKKS
ncbi:AlpA family transcriptional regulator [Alloalcanivorax balearicus]|nr:AlpA family transcriptional regulator [Alloalcanivorax balearicus]